MHSSGMRLKGIAQCRPTRIPPFAVLAEFEAVSQSYDAHGHLHCTTSPAVGEFLQKAFLAPEAWCADWREKMETAPTSAKRKASAKAKAKSKDNLESSIGAVSRKS